jgi:hypothetical protein
MDWRVYASPPALVRVKFYSISLLRPDFYRFVTLSPSYCRVSDGIGYSAAYGRIGEGVN